MASSTRPVPSLSPEQDRVSYADLAYNELLEAILQQRLRPGTRLVPETLAAQLGVSATPVKLALARLRAEGLVAAAPRRGLYVTKLDADELAALYRARLVLEAAAVREYGHRATPELIERLDGLADEYLRWGTEGGPHSLRRSSEADREFHRLLVGLTGNAHVVRWYERTNIHIQANRMVSPVSRLRDAHAEHRAIVEALRCGDVARTERAVRFHIERSIAQAERMLRDAADEAVLRPINRLPSTPGPAHHPTASR